MAAPEATEPTLARLSFWVPPERMGAFEAAYESRVSPLLQRHGLADQGPCPRPKPACVFSRLFAFESVSDYLHAHTQLEEDPGWQDLIRILPPSLGQRP